MISLTNISSNLWMYTEVIKVLVRLITDASNTDCKNDGYSIDMSCTRISAF